MRRVFARVPCRAGLIGLWALFYLASVLTIGWAQTRGGETGKAALLGLSLAQLFVGGAWFGWMTRRRDARRRGRAFPGALWLPPLVSLFVLEALAWTFVVPAPVYQTIPAGAALWRLFYHLVLVALAEEIWFRGLWFRLTGNGFVLSVLCGSVLFAGLHWAHGPGQMAVALSLGFLFATWRWLGAPIWSLALVHGLMNWVNSTLLPGGAFRFGETAYFTGFSAAVLLLAGGWILFARPPYPGSAACTTRARQRPGR